VDNNGSEEFRKGISLGDKEDPNIKDHSHIGNFLDSGSTLTNYTIINGLIVKK